MAGKICDWFQDWYLRMDQGDKKKEGIGVCLFFALLVFGVVVLTGTLTSGFHLVDDWEYAKYTVWMKLEGLSLWDCLKQAVEYDLTMRFRPLYYINRVLAAAVFGTNLTVLSVIKALEVTAAMTALYFCARRMRCNPVYAALFSLTVMVGYQSAVWWKLGPQESYGMLLFSMTFLFLLRWLQEGKRRDEILSVLFFFLMSAYKESFILLLPFAGLYVVWQEMRGGSFTLKGLCRAVQRRWGYLAAIAVIFLTEILLLVFVIGTNNYEYVGLDAALTWSDYERVWLDAAGADLKWYLRFGLLLCLILLTYWEHTKKLGWELLLMAAVILPQCVTYSKTAMTERYLLPGAFGFAFFFVVTGCRFLPLSGKRRILYMLCLLLMLAAHGRVVLREADYFTYRGESVTAAMEKTLELVQGTDKKALSCFYPNLEANRTMYYWFRLQGYDEFFYWEEERQIITREFGEREDETAELKDIDVILMYNEEDRHWCYTPSLDLSDFTEQKCGTITMYVRNPDETA